MFQASLGFSCHSLTDRLPNTVQWAGHMTSLGPVVGAGGRLGWDMEAFRRIPTTDVKMRQARKKELRLKYLNKKFLIGPKSCVPKSITEKLVEAAGSWSHLMNDSTLPDKVFQV